VMPEYTNSGVKCFGTSQSFLITVKPVPSANNPGDQTVCASEATTAVNFSGSGVPGTVYNWSNNTTSIGLGASGSGKIASFIAANSGTSPVAATITVTPVASGCSGPSQSFTITVNPTPTVNDPSDQSLCAGALSTAVTFVEAVPGTIFRWTNNTPSIGLGGSNVGNIPAFTAVNSSTSPVTATVTVMPEYTNSGVKCFGPAKNFTITVNPIPTVNAIPDLVVCNGKDNTVVAISGLVPNTVFKWMNDNTSIGVSSFDAGNIGPFKAINNVTAPVIANVMVTPEFTNSGKTCVGSIETFKITVNPTPTVAPIPNQVVCNGTEIKTVNFSGSVAGTVFRWTNSKPSIGLLAAGEGDIAAFPANNAGVVPVVAEIKVTPQYTNTETCNGLDKTFMLTVNPTPTVNDQADQAVCHGQATKEVNFTGAVMNTIFSWTNSNSSIGLGTLSNNGDILAFTGINLSGVTRRASIVVTPHYTNAGLECIGLDKSFDITVYDLPEAKFEIKLDGPQATFINKSIPGADASFTTSSWFWTFENAFDQNNVPIASSMQQTPPLISFKDGSNLVKLKVSDSYTCMHAYEDYALVGVSACGIKFADEFPIKGCINKQIEIKNTPLSGIGGTPKFEYVWSFPGGMPSTTTDAEPKVTYSTSGSFSFSVKLTVTGVAQSCDTTINGTIVIQPNPTAQITSLNGQNNINLCEGTPLELKITGLNNATGNYEITVNNVLYGNIPGTGKNISVTVPPGIGPKIFKIDKIVDKSPGSLGCENLNAPSNVTVNVRPLPKPAITINDNLNNKQVCTGNTIKLTANPPNLAKYEWKHSVQPQTPSGQNWEIQNASLGWKGRFFVTVTDMFGCVGATSDSVTVLETPAPTIVGNLEVCQNKFWAPYRNSNKSIGQTIHTWTWTPATAADGMLQRGDSIWLHWKAVPGIYTLNLQESVKGACSGTATATINVLNDAARDTVDIKYFSVGNLLIAKDSMADCYQWGRINLANFRTDTLKGENYQAYILGIAPDPAFDYWVEIWNSDDCSKPNKCATRSYYRSAQQPIVKELSETTLKVLPNPNDGSFRVRIDSPESGVWQYSCFDLLGRTVARGEWTLDMGVQFGILDLPKTALASGTYILRVSCATISGGQVFTDRVVIQR